MTSLYLDMDGRLHWFVGVPPQREVPAAEQKAPDWSTAFHEAGLDIAHFHPVASMSVPLHAYDARAAWDGPDPKTPGLITHVEAAAFHGRLTYFETIYPWDQATRQEQEPESWRDRMLVVAVIAVYILVLVAGAIIARRNLRQGRGDLRGATRLASVYFAISMLVWLFEEHHNGLVGREFTLFFIDLSTAFFSAFFLWMLYIALEPFVRKRWPNRIISWSRLLRGDYRDPMVGRDILVGAVFGGLMMLCTFLAFGLPSWIGRAPEMELNPGGEVVGSHFFARFASQMTAGLYLGLFSMFLLLLFVIALRNEWLALGLLWLILTFLNALIGNVTLLTSPFAALSAAVTVFILYRYGLLAMVSAMFVFHTWVFYPMTTELTAWYARDFTINLIILIALASYAFYISLGGEKLIRGGLLEE
jgi:serine/threonine-protein kinase